VSYGSQKLDQLLHQYFWQNFAITSPETLYMKDVANELSFLLVTHMTCFVIRFGCYRFLKSGFSARHILDNLGIQVLGQVFGAREGSDLLGSEYTSEGNKVSFLMPTQTHVFHSRRNGYDYLNIAYAWSLMVAEIMLREGS
jgi:hypothetical protein